MNIQKMMKQAQEMQNKMMQAQSALEALEVEGSAGSGAVTVVITGKKQLKKINIDASLLNADDKETLEDLIVIAINGAGDKVDAAAAAQMGALTGGMKLPAGMKLPF